MLKKRLYDEFKVEVPLTQHGNQKFVRISVQAYNTAEDINTLIEAMRILLPQVEA
jgi:isopenicillin-N epimerase